MLAARQGGALSIVQLRAEGFDDDRVHRLVRAGWLAREHRGVVRLGTLTPSGVLFAAVLAMGPSAAVSHRSAGHVLGYLRGRRPRIVDVTLPAQRRARRGIRAHRAKLDRYDVTSRDGLLVTSPSRTLLDLAAVLSEPVLQAAVDEARRKRQLRPRLVEAAIARAPGHHGIGALRRAAARHDPGRGPTREAFERRAAAFLRDRDYPPHLRNHLVEIDGERFLLDVVWPDRRVVLELDSREFHDDDPTFASDRRKSRRLDASGWRIVRATWDDFEQRPDELDADLTAILVACA